MQLEFFVNEQTIYALPTNSIPRQGSKEYLSLLFRFHADWSKYTKTIYFQYGEYSEPVLIGSSGEVAVPAYFTSHDSFLIMLVGIAGEERCPTDVLCITLEASGDAWESVPPDQEMPAYQQLVTLAQQAVSSADAAATAAENANKASVFMPHVSDDGTLSWSNDKGLPNPPEVNIKGPQGDEGKKGSPGAQGPKGDTGETRLPIARAGSADGIAYTATDEDYQDVLPEVHAGSNGMHTGKGRQIVFIPCQENLSNAPTLQLNGGEIIPIRLRAMQNQDPDMDDTIPDATLTVPVGALMRGVPYTMTFCGKYWLVDSQIALMDEESAAMAERIAGIAISMAAKQSIGFPIINGEDLNSAGIVDRATKAYISRAESESETHPSDGRVFIPTEKRVAELIRKDVTADYAAWTPESGTQKTVENYAKTLPDGKYYIIHGGTVYMDIFTVYGDVKHRFIRQYDDDACYIKLFRGDQLTICVEDDASSVMLYGRKMLTDWNIPLPTAADVGKVLMASAVNCAAWTEVTNAEEVAV